MRDLIYEDLTWEENQQVIIDMLESHMKGIDEEDFDEEKFKNKRPLLLPDAIAQIVKYYSSEKANNDSELYQVYEIKYKKIIKDLLIGTKFDRSKNHIYCIIWNRGKKKWEEISNSNFIYLTGATVATIIRKIIFTFRVDIFEASTIFLEAMKLGLYDKNYEIVGECLRMYIKRKWHHREKIVDQDGILTLKMDKIEMEYLYRTAFSKYRKLIDWYHRHGGGVKHVLDRIIPKNRVGCEAIGLSKEVVDSIVSMETWNPKSKLQQKQKQELIKEWEEVWQTTS